MNSPEVAFAALDPVIATAAESERTTEPLVALPVTAVVFRSTGAVGQMPMPVVPEAVSTTPPLAPPLVTSRPLVPCNMLPMVTPEAVRLICPLAETAETVPLTVIPPAVAFSVNDVEPELVARPIAPAYVSLTSTMPVGSVTVRVLALIELVGLNVTPPVPAERVSVAELRMPVPTMPPAALEAFSVKDEPELAARLTTPA